MSLLSAIDFKKALCGAWRGPESRKGISEYSLLREVVNEFSGIRTNLSRGRTQTKITCCEGIAYAAPIGKKLSNHSLGISP